MIKAIAIIISILFSNLCYSQVEKIDYISFTLGNARRIPNNSVFINIIEKELNCEVLVKSTPLKNSREWRKTKVDTSFSINKGVFRDLLNDIVKLNDIDLNRALVKGGYEGTICKIEFGTTGVSISYRFWTPTNLTELRSLESFLSLCNKLIIIGGLKPEEIL